MRALEHKIEDSETDILVTLDLAALYPQMERLLGKTRLKTLVVGEFAEMSARARTGQGADDGAATMLAAVGTATAASRSATCSTTTGAISAIRSAISTEAIAVLQYTGGTTGMPKGAMLTHANLTAACAQYGVDGAAADPSALRDGEERMLAVLPLFHIYALSVVMLLGLRSAPNSCCIRASIPPRR